MNELKYHYTEKGDLLYISNPTQAGSIGYEDDNRVVVFKHKQTNAVTGLLIFNYAKRLRENELSKLTYPPEIPYEEVVKFQLPMDI